MKTYTTGATTAGTVTSAAGAGSTWSAGGASLQADSATDDGTRSTTTISGSGSSNRLEHTNFGFSIPTRADILGAFYVVQHYTSTGDVATGAVRMIVSGSVAGDDKDPGDTPWATTTDEDETFGGARDTWGNTLTPALVNASDFGFGFVATNLEVTDKNAQVDYATAEILYSLPQLAGITARRGSPIVRIEVDWRADGDGKVRVGLVMSGILDRVITIPNPVDAPSANYDVYLRDAYDRDWFNGLLVNRHTSNTEIVYPYDGHPAADRHTEAAIATPVWLEIENAGADGAGLTVIEVSDYSPTIGSVLQ